MGRFKDVLVKIGRQVDWKSLREQEVESDIVKRFRTTLLVVAIFYAMFVIPVPYLTDTIVNSDLFMVMLGSSIGSFATLGISPLISAYIFTELMKKDEGISDPEEYRLVTAGWVAILTIAEAASYALLFRITLLQYLLAFVTFAVTGFIIYYLVVYDEVKGTGMAVTLIIFVSIAYRMIIGLLDPGTYGSVVPRGKIPALIRALSGEIVGADMNRVLIESITSIVALIVGLVLGVYLNSIKIRVAPDVITEIRSEEVGFVIPQNIVEPRLTFITTIPIILGIGLVRLIYTVVAKTIVLRMSYPNVLVFKPELIPAFWAFGLGVAMICLLLKNREVSLGMLKTALLYSFTLPAVYVFVTEIPVSAVLYLKQPVSIFETSIEQVIVYYAVFYIAAWFAADTWLRLEGMDPEILAKMFAINGKSDPRYQKWHYLFKYFSFVVTAIIVGFVAVLDLFRVPGYGAGVLVMTSIAVTMKDRLEPLVRHEYNMPSVSKFIFAVMTGNIEKKSEEPSP